jgi:hypothetical protein
MDLWFQALCFYCVTAAAPAPQVARASGDIRYTEEPLGGGARLLRLSTSDFIIDQDEWRQRRLWAFAESYAGSACHGRYQVRASRERIVIHPAYAKQFVFRCR